MVDMFSTMKRWFLIAVFAVFVVLMSPFMYYFQQMSTVSDGICKIVAAEGGLTSTAKSKVQSYISAVGFEVCKATDPSVDRQMKMSFDVSVDGGNAQKVQLGNAITITCTFYYPFKFGPFAEAIEPIEISSTSRRQSEVYWK